MAIHGLIPGVTVQVIVDGVPLQEYVDNEIAVRPVRFGEIRAARTTSKYVEAITGKEFQIRISISHEYIPDCPSLGFMTFVDGSAVSSRIASKKSLAHSALYSTTVEGARNTNLQGLSTLRPFIFSEIKTSSDDKRSAMIEEETKKMLKVGEITVEFHRKGVAARASAIDRATSDMQAPSEIHEKALKGDAKSHGVSLGRAVRIQTPSKSHSAYLDNQDIPLAIFRFRYRSKEALKQLLVIERSPEPEDAVASASDADIDVNQLDPEQRREARRLLRQLKRKSDGSNPNIKPEPGLRVKRESGNDMSRNASKRPRNSGPNEAVECIDLTED